MNEHQVRLGPRVRAFARTGGVFPRCLGIAGAALILAGACGCSSFGHAWRAAAGPRSVTADPGGRWDGVWRSDQNGHHGRLRCIVSPEGAGLYSARFQARYGGLLSFGYSVSLAATNLGPVWQFSGQADLGKLAGGLYQYRGAAGASNFFAVYQSKADHGTFEMKRVTP